MIPRCTSALCFCSILLFCCLPVKNGNFLSVFALTLQGFCFVCYSKRCTKRPGQSNNYFFFLMVRFICKITVNCVDKYYRTTLFLKPFLCILCTFLVHTVMEKK